MINEYSQLTRSEREELAERLAGGEITQADRESGAVVTWMRRDWFSIELSSGRTVSGSYGWDDQNPWDEWSLRID